MASRMSGRRRQSGATAIEFAFAFPVLFLLTYGALVYGYVFMAYQTIAFAAQSGAEAAVQVAANDSSDDYQSQVKEKVEARVAQVTSFLVAPASVAVTAPVDFGGGNVPDSVTVTVSYPIKAANVFPTFMFPPFTTSVPPYPDVLTAKGEVSLSPIS